VLRSCLGSWVPYPSSVARGTAPRPVPLSVTDTLEEKEAQSWLNRTYSLAAKGGYMVCSQCGTRLNVTARYCEECGAPYGQEAETRGGHLSPRAVTPREGAAPLPRRGLVQGSADVSAAFMPIVRTVALPVAAFWWMGVAIWLLSALALIPAASLAVLIMATALWLAVLNRRRAIRAFLTKGQTREQGGPVIAGCVRVGGWGASLVWTGLAVTGSSLAILWITLYAQKYYYWSFWNNPTQIVLSVLLLGSFWVFDRVWRHIAADAQSRDNRLRRRAE